MHIGTVQIMSLVTVAGTGADDVEPEQADAEVPVHSGHEIVVRPLLWWGCVGFTTQKQRRKEAAAAPVVTDSNRSLTAVRRHVLQRVHAQTATARGLLKLGQLLLGLDRGHHMFPLVKITAVLLLSIDG